MGQNQAERRLSHFTQWQKFKDLEVIEGIKNALEDSVYFCGLLLLFCVSGNAAFVDAEHALDPGKINATFHSNLFLRLITNLALVSMMSSNFVALAFSDPVYAKNLGVNVDALLVCQVRTANSYRILLKARYAKARFGCLLLHAPFDISLVCLYRRLVDRSSQIQERWPWMLSTSWSVHPLLT